MTPPLLSTRDLKKHFPVRGSGTGRWSVGRGGEAALHAVDGVSFDVERGETLGLVGESGCGKSTTGRCLVRLIEPTAGQLRYNGEDLLQMSRRELRGFRRRAQIVFQDSMGALNPRLRAGSVLEEVLKVHELGGRRAADRSREAGRLLERVGLGEEHRSRFPHELSGGQRQRLCIARALAVEPEFLVLDEPVSALDVSVRAQIVNLLVDLQRELGLTYLFIAHDISLVEYVSDRIAVMYLGRIVELGEAAEVTNRPQHPYTQALISSVPRMPTWPPTEPGQPSGGRIILRGDVPSPVTPPGGCAFHPRCPHPKVDERCRETGPPLVKTGPRHLCSCWKVPPIEGPSSG